MSLIAFGSDLRDQPAFLAINAIDVAYVRHLNRNLEEEDQTPSVEKHFSDPRCAFCHDMILYRGRFAPSFAMYMGSGPPNWCSDMTIDPTYPLYPIMSILSAALLLLLLVGSLFRTPHHLNLGVVFLCVWLLLQNITDGASSIIWSDNADVKHYVYCDIVSRINIVCPCMQSISAFIMLRRLHFITRLPSPACPEGTQRYRSSIVEWTLGLFVPMLVAGPLYYTVQSSRFQVLERFGCIYAVTPSILTIILLQIWTIVPAFLSLILYYPRVVLFFYRHHRDVLRLSLVSHTHYLRVMAIASLDVLFFLPLNIIMLVLVSVSVSDADSLPFYPGWDIVHREWNPRSVPYNAIATLGPLAVGVSYFIRWTPPMLTLVVFGLFGMTAEARASYRQACSTIYRCLRWKLTSLGRDFHLTPSAIKADSQA